MRKVSLLFLSLFIFSLISCENFMQGSDIKEQLDQRIAVANAKSVNIVISQDNTKGSFLSSGEKECKLGYSIEVQFTVKKEAYIYRGLKAVSSSNEAVSRNDCVVFSALESDTQRGVYKVAVKLVKEASDILIVPDCILIPNVVKENCFPSYDAGGWEQDTTVRIAFNTAVSGTQKFAYYITDNSGADMSSYYSDAYFSADGKTLMIPVNKNKRILDNNSATTTKDLIVKIDLSEIQDKDGNTGSGVYEHKYRVNRSRDESNPTLTSGALYTTSDTDSPYYKAIVSKNCEQWSGTGDSHGDYATYHVSGDLYIEVAGSDTGSGVSGVLVKETLVKYTDDSPSILPTVSYHQLCSYNEQTQKYFCNYTMNTSFDGIVKLEIFLEDFGGNTSTASYSYWVLKDTMIDTTLIKFNNEINVIKERGDAQAQAQALLEAIPVVQGDTQVVELHLVQAVEDIFYSGFVSGFNMDISWCYAEDESRTFPITKIDDQSFKFTRDVNKVVYIKIKCSDEVGNIREIVKIMDSRPEIDSFTHFLDGRFDPDHTEFWENEYINGDISVKDYATTMMLAKNTSSNYMDYISYVTFYYESKEDRNNPEKFAEPDSKGFVPDQFDWLQLIKDGYPVDVQALFSAAETNEEDEVELIPENPFYTRTFVTTRFGDFPSPVSKNYIDCCIGSWKLDYYDPAQTTAFSFVQNERPELMPAVIEPEDTDVTAYSKFVKTPFKVEAVPVQNSGYYKVTLSDYKGVNPSASEGPITYKFYAKRYTKNLEPDWHNVSETGEPEMVDVYSIGNYEEDRSSNEPMFYLRSLANYKFYIEVKGPRGSYFPVPIPSMQDFIQNVDPSNTSNPAPVTNPNGWISPYYEPPALSFYENNKSQIKKSLILSKDLNPPVLKSSNFDYARKLYPYMYTASYYKIPLPRDDEGNMYEKSEGIGEITYYFIPNTGYDLRLLPQYTKEELETYYSRYKKTLEYPFETMINGQLMESAEITIPFGNLKDGYYTLCVIAKDKEENYIIVNYPCINRCFGSIPYLKTIDEQTNMCTITVGSAIDPQTNEVSQVDNYYFESSFHIDGDESKPTKYVLALQAYVHLYSDYTSDWSNLMPVPSNGDFQQSNDDMTYNLHTQRYPLTATINDQIGKWVMLSAAYDNRTDLSPKTKGFYYNEYIYLGNDTECNDCYNYLEAKKGYQVFAENAVLAHTFYSLDKLTERNTELEDARIWELNGFETGIQMKSGNFTYEYTNLEKVPDGYWYVTIFQYADGTRVMTDIRQK